MIRGRGPCRDYEAIPVFGAEPVWLVPEWELGLPDEEVPKDLPEEADEAEEWLLYECELGREDDLEKEPDELREPEKERDEPELCELEL